MKMRLAVAVAGVALACAGCNLVPGSGTNQGTAQATVTYQDDSGVHTSEVTVGSIRCDFTGGRGGFLTLKTDSGQVVLGTVSDGSTVSLSMTLGHDALVFHAAESVEADEDGVEFSDLQGEVLRTSGEEPNVVDPAATATGSIICP